MQLFVNELSLHGQFNNLETFKLAINRLMAMRGIAQTFGRELKCHRRMAYAQVTREHSMQHAIKSFNKNEQRSIMQWLTKTGPFWEDSRTHSPDEYMECNELAVTDTALGEAAFCCYHSIKSDLVSLTPSLWESSPLNIVWTLDSGDERFLTVINHWRIEELRSYMQAAPLPISSWGQMKTICISRCPNLTFSEDCFEPLHGHPFVLHAAKRIVFILDTLNRLKHCFDENGHRTPEGNEIYSNFFTGKKGNGGRGALFSESSTDEKRMFEKELTFRHPADANANLFCSWHGKVQTPQMRVHFSYPIRSDAPLYIVYVGPKITKR